MKWSDLHLDEDPVLTIQAQESKTDQLRHIELSYFPNLIDWLRTFTRKPERRILEGFTKQTLRTARRKLWQLVRAERSALPPNAPHNCLRHLFCSMHFAKFKSVGLLLEQAGHSERVNVKHYRHAARPAEANRYWEIRPRNL